MSLKMALSIPLEDILAYQKVAKAYFGLMEVLCHSHVHVIAACDTTTFTFLLSSLDSGLKSLDNSVCSLCAQAIDNLAGQYFKGLQAAADDQPNTTAQVQYDSLNASSVLLHVWSALAVEPTALEQHGAVLFFVPAGGIEAVISCTCAKASPDDSLAFATCCVKLCWKMWTRAPCCP